MTQHNSKKSSPETTEESKLLYIVLICIFCGAAGLLLVILSEEFRAEEIKAIGTSLFLASMAVGIGAGVFYE